MKPTKAQILDFTVLALRWYLAYYMADYGYGKMTGHQFGLTDPTLLDKPLREIDKFHLAWYLFSLDKSFDIGAGLLQITGAVLIVLNRTVLLGALLLLPVLGQIFLVDLAFTTSIFGPALVIRLIGMILADLFILYYYKDRMILVWHNLTDKLSAKFKYAWWVFVLMPFIGMAMDFVMAILAFPVKMLLSWLSK